MPKAVAHFLWHFQCQRLCGDKGFPVRHFPGEFYVPKDIPSMCVNVAQESDAPRDGPVPSLSMVFSRVAYAESSKAWEASITSIDISSGL